MANDENSPKLHIDSDWKAQAQAEKERLAAKEQEQAATGQAGAREMPEANFQTLMSVLASQAIMGLGAYADPQSGKAVIDLEGARFSIDLLGVLEEKTQGNITEDEAKEIKQLLHELRQRYVQIQDMVAKQQAGQATTAQTSGQSGGQQGQGGGQSPIVEP